MTRRYRYMFPPTSVELLRGRVAQTLDRVATYGMDDLTVVLRSMIAPRPLTMAQTRAIVLAMAYRLRRSSCDLDAEELHCALEGDDEEATCDSFARKFEGE